MTATPPKARDEDDPGTRLARRGGLVFLVGGFLVFTVPQAVVGLASGDTQRVIGSAIALAFWAWLTWRAVLVVRRRDEADNPRYWYVSAIGYAMFFAIYVAVALWQSVDDGFEGARRVPFMVILFGLTLVASFAGRKAAGRRDDLLRSDDRPSP